MALVALFWARPENRDDAFAIVAEDPGKPAVGEREINIVYTVNNLGYTDTCG
ncbi:MAG TPA: hypothetical protein VK116_01720 [Planctomycetota bacterium]|nr:hypothetical protein [Planctomycetota bacterium]